jgi:hypothetical protein
VPGILGRWAEHVHPTFVGWRVPAPAAPGPRGAGPTSRGLVDEPLLAGANPAPATMNDEGLADATAANPFVYPDFTQQLVRRKAVCSVD